MSKQKKPKTSDGIVYRDPKTGQSISKYKPEYDQLLLDHLSEGYSFESFAAIAKVNRDTLYEWEKKHKSFAEAKQLGVAKSLLFWEKMGMAGMVGKIDKFNVTSWIFNMKNRFGWRDRQEIKKLEKDQDFGEVTHEKIMQYIEGKKF